MGYLMAWPTGAPELFVSSLNSRDGPVGANAAIVPAVLDIHGCFAP